MGIFSWYKYIPQEGLENLRVYRYSCTDLSWLTNERTPWICCIAKLFDGVNAIRIPQIAYFLSPNLVTLIGFFGILFSYSITAFYAPTLTEPLPAWVNLFNAFAMLFYQTFDALDGKQARRTGSSSPLGELFDHGCDAMTTVLAGLITLATFQLGSSINSFYTLLTAMVLFFFSQWDVYWSGKLFLGPFNVTETQFIMIITHLCTAYFGPQLWTLSYQISVYNITIAEAIIYFAYVMAAYNMFDFVRNVIKSVREQANWTGEPSELASDAFATAFPGIFGAIAFSLWYHFSPALWAMHVHVFSVAMGFAFCNLVGRIVTARVCHVRFSSFYWVLAPLPMIVANAYLEGRYLDQVNVLYLYSTFSVLSYLHFGISLIDEMTAFLGIRAFVIPYPNAATENDPWAKLFRPAQPYGTSSVARTAASFRPRRSSLKPKDD